MQTVYIAEALRRYPIIYLSIGMACRECGINHGIIMDTPNIWARDYMPVQTDSGFVKFRYKSGLSTYDIKKYPQLKVLEKCWDWLPNVKTSEIVLDGGNCVRGGDKFYITDIVFKHNPRYRKIIILNRLEKILGGQVILIPHEPYDDLGHSDGILKPIGDSQVFINDYSVMGKEYTTYYSKLIHALTSQKIDCVPFPYAYNRQPKMSEKEFRKKYPGADDFNPAVGYYINYLIVGKMIIMPQFGIEEDEKAVSFIKRWFNGSSLYLIDCADLAMEGGMIQCVTWGCNL